MTNRVNGWRGVSAPLAAAVGVTAWALVLCAGGCDQRSASAKAIEKGTDDLHAMSGSSPEPALSGTQQKTFTKVSADLSSAAGSSDAGDKGSASLLVCQAQSGLGNAAGADAAALERTALNAITVVNSQLSQWRMRSAVAGAAEAYDPSAQRADIVKSKADKDTAIQRETAHKGQVETQLNDLKARSKAKMDAAAVKEAEYGKRMQEAVKMTATAAAPVVERANATKREADALRLEGTKLEAQAQSIAPLVTEIDAIIAQLSNQKKDLEATDASLAQQLAASKQEAAEARAGATAASVEIEKQVAALAHVRGDELEPAYAKALGFFGKAFNAARDSSAQAPAGGKAAMGDTQMSIADMHWQKSQGLKTYALLLEDLAGVTPALPGKSDYAEKAKAARDQAKQELEAAATALEAAKNAFTSARLTGDAKDKMTKLGELLDTALKVSKEDAQGTSTDLVALTGRSAPAAAPAGTTPAPEAAAGDAAGALRSTAEAFVAANQGKKWADVAAMMSVPDGARSAVASSLQLSEKQARLDAAFKAKFGKSMLESAASNPMLAEMLKSKGFDPANLVNVKAADLKATVNGDKGTVAASGLDQPLTFKNVGGKWLFTDPMVDMLAAQAPMLAPMLGTIGKAMDDFAGEVESGKYADANAAMLGFQGKMMQMMSGAGGPKKGPGGGGG